MNYQPPTEYYVSINGDDLNPGFIKALPWRSFAHAAGRLRAGDTLWVVGPSRGRWMVFREPSPTTFVQYDG